MFKGGFVVNEFTLQAGFEQPFGNGGISCGNVTKVNGEGWAYALPINFGANNLEVNE